MICEFGESGESGESGEGREPQGVPVERRACGRSRARVAALLFIIACDPETATTPGGAEVAADADLVLAAEIVQVRLYHRLRQVNLDGVAIADAGPTLAQQIPNGLAADLVDPMCMSVVSDGMASLDFTFDGCEHVLVGRLDGGIRLDFVAAAGLCGVDPCVVAVDYTLTVRDLEIRDSNVERADASLRVPTDLASPVVYASEAELPGDAGRLLHGRSDASIAYAPGCVTADFGVEIETPEGKISVGGRGVESCAGGCPDAGVVQLAWGAGAAISWEYTGDQTIEVEGPRGLHFELAALCASI